MPITYAQEQTLTAADYIACVGRTTLGPARPLGAATPSGPSAGLGQPS